MRRLHETLQAYIQVVIESLKQLRANPDYDLANSPRRSRVFWMNWRRSGRNSWKLKMEADRLGKEIKRLSGSSTAGRRNARFQNEFLRDLL